jgi:hypothetical protein
MVAFLIGIYLIVVLICTFLIISDVKHLFLYAYWAFVYLLWELFPEVLHPFFNWFIFLLLTFSIVYVFWL